MRLDKFLKVSRIIKRRTVANEAADGGRISVNGRVVKPSYEVKVDDIVEIKFGDKISKFKRNILYTPYHKQMYDLNTDTSKFHRINSYVLRNLYKYGTLIF